VAFEHVVQLTRGYGFHLLHQLLLLMLLLLLLLLQEFCDSGTLAKMSGGWLPSNEDDAQMLKRLVLLQDVAQGLRWVICLYYALQALL
jgi:hypothetical protein